MKVIANSVVKLQLLDILFTSEISWLNYQKISAASHSVPPTKVV